MPKRAVGPMSAVWGRAAQAAVEPASLRWLPAPSFVSVLAPKSGSFSLPPARAEGEGTRPPAARGVFGGAFYSAHARSLPVPQVATERAAGGDARLLSVNYNPLLGGLSLRCRSAFSGKKKKKGASRCQSRSEPFRLRSGTYRESLPLSEIAERAG